jgi:hypothetical protein
MRASFCHKATDTSKPRAATPSASQIFQGFCARKMVAEGSVAASAADALSGREVMKAIL